LQLADARDEASAVVARTVAGTIRATLARPCAEDFGHLGLQHLLDRLAQQLLEEISILPQQAFDRDDGRFTLLCGGHGGLPPSGGGWLRQSTSCHDCRPPSSGSAHNSGHYPISVSASAPDASRSRPKLAGSIRASTSASRHNSEFAANASIATQVSSSVR